MSLPFYYTKAPVFIQNLFVSLKGFLIERQRFNKDFVIYLEKFEKSDNEKIDEIQLRKFLISASQTKFWKKRFHDYCVDIHGEDLIVEIQKLPILSKEDVIQKGKDIEAKNIGVPIKKVRTSGTTGTNLNFIETSTFINKQWAIWWRYRRKLGIDRDTWCGWLAGKQIVPVDQSKPPYWRYNLPGKQLMFSAYHLNEETAGLYFNTLAKQKIEWIHGFPSQIALLASYVEEQGLGKLPFLKIITYGSENLFGHQEVLINRVFGVPIRTHYGLSEGVSNISQLPDGSYEIDQDFAFSEFIRSKENSDQYRIIGTNYWNEAFPLIRYDTSDLVQIKEENGREKIIRIDGRADDYIVRPDGVRIARLGYLFTGQDMVKEAQIYQPSKEEIIFRIVPRANYDVRKSEKEIKEAAESRLGKGFIITFQYLDEIPKTNSNKLKYVVSDVI